jgi:formylglycine-generating enzyme required for sulfatase activity
VISNDDDINDEDELYSMLAGACEVQGQLENFREVDVSDKMKSLVSRFRKEVEAAQINAKRETEEAYEKFRGREAGEEKMIEIAPGVTMTFCWCPPGGLMMGSPELEKDRRDNENQVKVTISNGFWMAKTEVTQSQWQAVMGCNPSRFKSDELPVERVSWHDAQEFIEKLNAKLGPNDVGIMFLPTEAQWEYAARAGELGPHQGRLLDEVAWYTENSGMRAHPVGTKNSNAWGLHDMLGNVWEWCADWYDKNLPGGVDPKGASSGTNRVIRGGSGDSHAGNSRVASRLDGRPSFTSICDIGFRVLRSSIPK